MKLHLSIFVLLSILILKNHSEELVTPLMDLGIFDYCTTLNRDFLFAWTYNSENDTITVGLSSLNVGYQALGFNVLPQMIETDVMIAQFVNGVGVVQDYYISLRQSCISGQGVCLDSTYGGVDDNPIIISSKRTNSSTFFAYNRFRVGSDPSPVDAVVPVENQINLVWALGSTDTISYHIERATVPFYLTDPILSCPGNCSDHGTCYGGGCCSCDIGYTGTYCEDSSLADIGEAYVNTSDYEYGGSLDDNLDLYWNIRVDGEDIPFLDVGMIYKGSSVGWFAIGFSQSSGGHMSPSDDIVCDVFSPTTYTVLDYTFTERSMSGTLIDTSVYLSDGQIGQDNIFASNATGSGDRMYCKWRRYLDTHDELDSIVENKEMKCIYAHSQNPNWSKHDWRNKGRVKINWFTGSIEKETNLWVIHGGLMFVSWGIMIPLASILARYFKFIGDAWFQTHRAVQIVSVFAQIAGFAVVVAAVNREDTSHFSNTHGQIGIVVFILGSIQPFIGQLADFMFNPKREKVPIFPDRIHAVFGWTAVILGFVNIGLGLDFYQSPSFLIILYSFYVVALGFVGVVAHFFSSKIEKSYSNNPINYSRVDG